MFRQQNTQISTYFNKLLNLFDKVTLFPSYAWKMWLEELWKVIFIFCHHINLFSNEKNYIKIPKSVKMIQLKQICFLWSVYLSESFQWYFREKISLEYLPLGEWSISLIVQKNGKLNHQNNNLFLIWNDSKFTRQSYNLFFPNLESVWSHMLDIHKLRWLSEVKWLHFCSC